MFLILAIVFSLLIPFNCNASLVFINEIHYDNSGGDINEYAELAGIAGTSLFGWSLVLYNGTANSSGLYVDYKTKYFGDITLTDQTNGYGFITANLSGMQNGSPDGIALVNNLNQLVQFISYEGDFIASTGVAAGVRSQDIGVVESSTTPTNWSLQLSGSGAEYNDFTWQAAEQSFGVVNQQQNITSSVIPPFTQVTEPNTLILLLFIPLVLMASHRNRQQRKYQRTERN